MALSLLRACRLNFKIKNKMRRRTGFTLMEIMIVFAIVGLIAAVALPRISFYFEPPSSLLQRSIEEARDLALNGVSI
ncbi:MAG: type II secretion system protein, partial [Synergistaceae bacterium]|nr:type II secretion system protein [Synergistaceae bacterium]